MKSIAEIMAGEQVTKFGGTVRYEAPKRKFWIVKMFVGGILDGLTYEEFTDVEFTIGQLIERPIGGSPYRIIIIERL